MSIRAKVDAAGHFPTVFAAVPRPGEYVRGTRRGKEMVVKVSHVTHGLAKAENARGDRTYKVPQITVHVLYEEE